MFTDKNIAMKVLETMDEVTMFMNQSLFDIRMECLENEFNEYRVAVGGVMAEIYIRVRAKIYERFPDLEPQA